MLSFILCYLFLALLFPLAALEPEAKSSYIALPNGPDVNLEKKEVRFPAVLVNVKDPLEFVLSYGRDKDYESILCTTVSGTMLHFAMTTVGMNASSFTSGDNLQYGPMLAEQHSKGSRLGIDLEWQGEKAKVRVKLSEVLLRGTDKVLESNQWFFAGSYHHDQHGKQIYAADESLNLIAAFPALDMVIGPDFSSGNPYDEGESLYLKPNGKLLPPVGTQMMIYIYLLKDNAK